MPLDTAMTIKHIFNECGQYEERKEKLTVNNIIAKGLGPDPANE